MKKTLLAISVDILALLLLLGLLWKYATRDPLSGTFKTLKAGMTRAEVSAIFAEACPDCELILDEDSGDTTGSFWWNNESYNDPQKKDLVGGFSVTYTNSSYIWFEYEDDILKNAGRTHNYSFYLNIPPQYRDHRHRGYTVTENECLQKKDCEKKALVSGGLVTYDEHEDWAKLKNWFKKIFP